MRSNHLIIIICLIFLFGCSQKTPEQKTILSPTAYPVVEVSTLQIPSQTASTSPEPQVSETAKIEDLVPSTSTSELTKFSVEGVEAQNLNDIEIIAQAGQTWTRRNGLLWHLVEPVEGDRNWAAIESLEAELIDASASGLKTILIVRSTPDWAQKVLGFYCGPVREDQLSSMGDFLYDAVQRYSQPPYNVKYWELGNEPDVNVFASRPDMQYGCWGDNSDSYFGGGYYAEMLKIVYPRIKSADPQAQVLIGGLLLDCDPISPPEIQAGSGQFKDCKPATFLEGVLSNGGGNFFDGVAFHAYDYYYGSEGQYGNPNWHSSWNTTGPVLIAKANYLRQMLESYGFEDKYLVNSEGALICGRHGNEPACVTDSFNQTKASYLVQSFAISRALGLSANIWYSLQGWRGSSLIDNEGNLQPAYQALIFNTSILKGVDFLGEINDYEGIYGISFENKDSTIWILWSTDGLSKVIEIKPPPDKLYDLFGRSVSSSSEISIGSSPFYLIWNK